MDDRDILANLIDPNALELDAYPWPRDAADRVLASDWLAARDARVRAEALEEAAELIRHKQHAESVRQMLTRQAAEYRKEITE